MKVMCPLLLALLTLSQLVQGRARVLVTTDGEIDDECSMVRFLLCANEFDVEGIVLTSSQYHWRGHRWAGDDWVQPYLDAYEKVYPNLVQHDPRYPKPTYLRERTVVGNVNAEGEMEEITPGSELIVRVLLDRSDPRPVWIQAWGGINTIARALKTIEERYPERMEEVARKIRFFFIWEQDSTYQDYIRPHWGRHNILTIVSDQFEVIAYDWRRLIPPPQQQFFSATWMKQHILDHHGPLTALYKAQPDGSFRSEGDSPAFLHAIDTGLRNLESPDWGGWGGRYVRVRENIWLDPVPEPGYRYPEGRWFAGSAWGRLERRKKEPNYAVLTEYYRPIWQWVEAVQNDFAARADWCVRSYREANHPPVVKLGHPQDLKARPGQTVRLDARPSTDPDGNRLNYNWWHYREAGTYRGQIEILHSDQPTASFVVPRDATEGDTIHVICQVTDSGEPPLTRYRRVIVTVQR